MAMNRTRVFLQNSGATLLLQIVTMLSGFIIPKIMIEVYGSEINGLVSSITQFISYFTLVEAGISGATVYALYKPLASRDRCKINGILVAARNFYYKSGYAFVLLTTIFSVVYPFMIETNELPLWEIGCLVLVLGVSATLDFFTLAKYRSLLTADQKTYIISVASMLSVIINTAIIATLSIWKIDVVLVRFLGLFSVVLRSVILYWYSKKNYTFLDFHAVPDIKALDKRWNALFLQVLGPIQQGTPVILATLMTSLKMVSVYSVYNLVMTGVNSLLSVFISGLSASFGDVIARGENETLKKAYNEFEAVYYMIIAIAYGITVSAITSFVVLYTQNATDMNYNVPLVGFLLSLNGLFYNLKTPQGMMVIAAGLYKETQWQALTQAIIAVIGGIICGFFGGLPGIIIGQILSNLYRDIDLAYYIPRQLIKTTSTITIRRMFICCLSFFLIYFPSICFEYEISSYAEWMEYVLVVGMYSVCVVGTISAFFEREILSAIISRVTKR